MKIIIKSLDSRNAKGTMAKVRRVRDAEGRLVTVRAVDSGSRQFGSALRSVFATNVSKARKDNKAIAGVRDRAPAKR